MDVSEEERRLLRDVEAQDSIPCQIDFAATGNDWTAPARAEVNGRYEIKQKAALCRHACPIRDACADVAGALKSNAFGVWGGDYYYAGWKVDPFGLDAGNMRSVYRRVHWDSHRGKWKAEAQVEQRRVHIGYFSNEDDAAWAVQVWEDENGYAEDDG